MSRIRTRVEKLEVKGNHDFRVIVPTEFDRHGKPFDAPPKEAQVHSTVYQSQGQRVHVTRLDGEAYLDFQERALAAAEAEFGSGPVYLEADCIWL